MKIQIQSKINFVLFVPISILKSNTLWKFIIKSYPDEKEKILFLQEIVKKSYYLLKKAKKLNGSFTLVEVKRKNEKVLIKI